MKIVEHLNFNTDLSSTESVNLAKFADLSIDLIIECLMGQLSPLARDLLMTAPLEERVYAGDVLFFSGGVGDLFYQDDLSSSHLYRYFDVGPLMAISLQRNSLLRQFNTLKPGQTIRATVIGAGAYSLSLSGSTIWIDDDQLPLRNIQVLFPRVDWQSRHLALDQALRQAAQKVDLDLSADLYGIFLPQDMPVTYQAVHTVADELARFYNTFLLSDKPVLVLSYNDVGKVLGMLLGPQIKPKPLAVIDEVDLKEWDYVDIGKSYFGGAVVPLTVKSLVFPK